MAAVRRTGQEVLSDNAAARVRENRVVLEAASMLAERSSPDIDRVGLLRDCIEDLNMASDLTKGTCYELGHWIAHFKNRGRPFDELWLAELSATYSVLLQQHRA